jgi:DUF1365 family protein
MNPPAAELLLGRVMHRRLRPVENRFVYGVYFLRVPLSRLDSIAGPLLSINRWNLLGFDFRDYGARDGSHPLARGSPRRTARSGCIRFRACSATSSIR